jgi:hypothetical protein
MNKTLHMNNTSKKNNKPAHDSTGMATDMTVDILANGGIEALADVACRQGKPAAEDTFSTGGSVGSGTMDTGGTLSDAGFTAADKLAEAKADIAAHSISATIATHTYALYLVQGADDGMVYALVEGVGELLENAGEVVGEVVGGLLEGLG